MLKKILSFTIVLVMAVLVGCGGGSGSGSGGGSGSLVGTWESETESGWLIVFNQDGSGKFFVEFDLDDDNEELFELEDMDYEIPFTWETAGSTLTLSYDDMDETFSIEYEISGNVLSIIDEWATETFIRR